MSEYKDTLNLPQTDFAMKANLSQREPTLLKKWYEMDLYAKLRARGEAKKKFILEDGPPYANGHIHVGHAVNKILKDIIVKSKTMSGYDAPYVPGWDCHGLPIELNVEKKHGKPGRKLSPAEFRVACREYASSQINIQREEFKRLGVLGEWDHPYLTMDFGYEANIIRSLAKIIKNNHVQKGYKPVHWCLDCASALSEAEVEYADKTSPSIDVRFSVVDVNDFMQRFDEPNATPHHPSVAIWTTTPWTLPANQAVSLHPTLSYVLVDCDGREQLLIAEALLPQVMARYSIGHHSIVARTTGERLLGVKLQHPLFEREVPIVLGEHVTVESGTGAVHTAPAHGVDDYAMGKQYHLPLDNPVGDDGCYTAVTPIFAGIHVSKANEKVLEILDERQVLITQTSIRHSYPHCWRHKTPLIFRATPQWFISMEKHHLREQALKAIDSVKWIPDWGKSRIQGMVEGRPDWCISRQRTWGVPLALFTHKETGELHPNTPALMEEVAKRVEQQGVEAWFALEPSELLGADANQYTKAMDVLDVWFDSGVVHECLPKTHPEITFPADMVLEGSDQHRGWFQSLMLTSVAINNAAPYRAALTHGFVVDGQGRKMSKSIGNVIAPEEIIQTLGADILRLWTASIDYKTEIAASKEIFTRTSETYRRFRNTARFFLANLHGFDPAQHMVPHQDMLVLDQWALDKARLLQKDIIEAYETCQFHLVVQKLHHFFVADMGGFYLDVIKDRQYTMATNSRGRRSAQTALYHIIHALVRMMAPVLSFTAEEIWQFIPGEKAESVMLTEWYTELASLPSDAAMNEAYWESIRQLRDVVNKEIENLRNAGKLGSALEADVYLYCDPELKAQLDLLGDELRFVLITSSATVLPKTAEQVEAVATDMPGLALHIQATEHAKCERCWHRRADVGASEAHPGICGRCVDNIAGTGEVRSYA